MADTRQETYLNKMAGNSASDLPEPVTQIEKYWHDIAKRVAASEGDISGTINIEKNGQYDVTVYKTANVNVATEQYDSLKGLTIDTDADISYVNTTTPYFSITADSSKTGVLKSGETVKANISRDKFGDASDSQVVKDVYYTSKNGLKRRGTHVCSGGGSTSGIEIYSAIYDNIRSASSMSINTGLSDVKAIFIQASSIQKDKTYCWVYFWDESNNGMECYKSGEYLNYTKPLTSANVSDYITKDGGTVTVKQHSDSYPIAAQTFLVTAYGIK